MKRFSLCDFQKADEEKFFFFFYFPFIFRDERINKHGKNVSRKDWQFHILPAFRLTPTESKANKAGLSQGRKEEEKLEEFTMTKECVDILSSSLFADSSGGFLTSTWASRRFVLVSL